MITHEYVIAKERFVGKVLIAEDDLMIADFLEEILLEAGYTVCGIRAPSVAVVLLSVMEAIEQAAHADSILVNDLGEVWRLAEDRMARAALAQPRS